jgi:hypothetical protein
MLRWRWTLVTRTRIESLESREKKRKGNMIPTNPARRVLMVRRAICCVGHSHIHMYAELPASSIRMGANCLQKLDTAK